MPPGGSSVGLQFPPPKGILGVVGQGYYAIPSLAAGVAVNPGTNTYGVYAQISAGEPRAIFITHVQIFLQTPAADLNFCQLAIGLGTLGFEQTVAEFRLQAFDFISGVGVAGYAAIALPYPIAVPAGVKISGKGSQNSGITAWNTSLNAVAQSDLVLI